MQVKDLRQLLEGVDDEMQVLIPLSEEFDGLFTSPCMGESGVSELGFDEDSEGTEDKFLLVPHGFFNEDDDDEIDPELN